MRKETKLHIFSDEFIENMPLILIGFDREGNVNLWNKRAEKATGFRKREVFKKKSPYFLNQLFNENKKAEFEDYETMILTKNGEVKDILWNGYIMREKRKKQPTFIITGMDVTSEKKVSQELKKYRSIDPHTGVVNYRHFMTRLGNIFRKSFLDGKPMSLLMLNINYFNSINKTYGIAIGNEVIRKLAELIKENSDSSYTIARFSGTEFAILMPETDIQKAYKFGGRLFSTITSHDFEDVTGTVKLNISIGMALGGYPHCEDVCTPEQLLDRVVEKLGEARKSGASTVLVCTTRKTGGQFLVESKPEAEENNYQYTMEFVTALANAVRTKDYYTQKHSATTANYAAAIAEQMGLSNEEVQHVKIGAMLHDIGKIGIDRSILLKPGPLTTAEFAMIRHHPRIGAEIIRNVHPLKESVPYVLHHHERYDGQGYPNGLKGEEIPIGARIISLVDVFQSLTSDRPYRKALPEKEALSIIRSNSGKRFDPKVVKAFFDVYEKIKQEAD